METTYPIVGGSNRFDLAIAHWHGREEDHAHFDVDDHKSREPIRLEACILRAEADLGFLRENWVLGGFTVFPENYQFKPDPKANRFLFSAKYNVKTRKGEIKIISMDRDVSKPSGTADQPNFSRYWDGQFEITTSDGRKIRGIINDLVVEEGRVTVMLANAEEKGLRFALFWPKECWVPSKTNQFTIDTAGEGVHVFNHYDCGLCSVLNTKTGEVVHFKNTTS